MQRLSVYFFYNIQPEFQRRFSSLFVRGRCELKLDGMFFTNRRGHFLKWNLFLQAVRNEIQLGNGKLSGSRKVGFRPASP